MKDGELKMMLELNEKKIRKGKAIGLPYQGSKKKISKKIVEIIKQNFGTDKPIYDIFGGGGAITAECMLNGLEVHYNDLDRTITDMFQRVLATDREFLKTLIISRDEFFKIRDKENKTIDDELKLLVNSFGNNRKNYLYSKEFSDLKYNLAIEIIKKHDTFEGYKKTETYKKALRLFDVGKEKKNQVLQQLSRLQQLLYMQQLEGLQKACIKNLKITNHDYTQFSYLTNAIIYLDPPYEGTTHKGYKTGTFNSQSFYDWAYEMSKKNIVLISSYEISDERFESVFEFKKARSTFKGGTRNNKTEKLFMVKKKGVINMLPQYYQIFIYNNELGIIEKIEEDIYNYFKDTFNYVYHAKNGDTYQLHKNFDADIDMLIVDGDHLNELLNDLINQGFCETIEFNFIEDYFNGNYNQYGGEF